MEKPITVARNEYIQQIVALSNQAQLPAFAKIEVLKLCIDELQQIAEQELQRDTELYNQSLEVTTDADDNV